jgi:hypothetical protein
MASGQTITCLPQEANSAEPICPHAEAMDDLWGPTSPARSTAVQALSSLRPWSVLEMEILRGLARSAIGMRRVSTPAS